MFVKKPKGAYGPNISSIPDVWPQFGEQIENPLLGRVFLCWFRHSHIDKVLGHYLKVRVLVFEPYLTFHSFTAVKAFIFLISMN